MRRLLIASVLLFVALLSVAACRKAPAVGTGERLPTLVLTDTEGGKVKVPDDLRGAVTVLLFWHEGCNYCKEGMPATEKLYRAYKDKGFEFVAVQVGGDAGSSREIKARLGLTFPMLHDKGSLVRREYGVVGVPSMFFLEGGGVLTEKVLGELRAENLEGMLIEKLGTAAKPH